MSEDAWWDLHYTPLEKRLKDMRTKYKDNPKTMKMIEDEQLEIDLFRKFNSWYSSVFFVMQKQ